MSGETFYGLRGEPGAKEVTPVGTALGDAGDRCRAVVLSNWNVADDIQGTKNTPSDKTPDESGSEIFYGFGGIPTHQLFPSQTTGLIPCQNLGEIFVKTKPGKIRKVFFTIYR